MRAKKKRDGLTVKGVGGTHVVMLNMDLERANCKGLLGFGIHRTDHTENEAYWLQGKKVFESVPRDAPPGGKVSTRKHPVQDFSWSDYSAKPGHEYTYAVHALYGKPADPEARRIVELPIATESEEGGDHDIYFNRGAAASQEYASRFQNQRPDKAGEEAWRWLSRGLHEALLAFIARAKGKGWRLRVAAYEFTEREVLAALRDAKTRGVDVRVVYHAREGVSEVVKNGKTSTTQTGHNREAAAKAKIKGLCTERLAKPKAAISHNKFIVLLKGETPLAVLTGSTNFSTGGIFGHSNVVHVVEDQDVAASYLAYWELLRDDPEKKELASTLTGGLAMPGKLPAKGSTCVFSPRNSTDALECYARLAANAKEALFVTLAFGMHSAIQEVFRTGSAPLRFGLMEKMVMASSDKAKDAAALAEIKRLRKMPENRIGVGAFLSQDAFGEWFEEQLSGLNVHVRFVHTKYMIIDPLSSDPIVVTGSANFSKASCVENDENMLIIRGNTRVADIYLGEFMRLYRHYAFRDYVNNGIEERSQWTPQFLDEQNTWWKGFYGDTPNSRLREYFAG